jgi:hypothetical protein
MDQFRGRQRATNVGVRRTFLRSSWSCIYGAGCKGVLDDDATEMQQGCCSFGAHFVDDADVSTTMEYVGRLGKKHWQFRKIGRRDGVLDTDEGATVTKVHEDACIFLNRPGFEGGVGCAFHIAAVDAGERPLDWKPDVCWQLPLRLEQHTDDNGYVTSTLREWKRRDWGAGGAEFHWWCTDAGDAFVGKVPVYQYLRDEIIEMVGEHVYQQMVAVLERPRAIRIAHPAVRR